MPARTPNNDLVPKLLKNFVIPFAGLAGFGVGLLALATRPDIARWAQHSTPASATLVALKIVGGGFVLWGFGCLIWQMLKWFRMMRKELRRLGAHNANLEEQVRWRDLEPATRTIERARAMWSGRAPLDPTLSGYEDDPVYLQLGMDSELAKILCQPIVQRLNHVRHLSFAYLIFRSATHTRLAHSLGACRNAEVVMSKVFREGRLYSRASEQPERIMMTDDQKTEYLKLAKVVALLHDLGHGPLSHALDIHIGLGKLGAKTITPDKEFSRAYIRSYLADVLRDARIDLGKVLGLMEEDKQGLEGWLAFIGDLIDSPLDVDRMDYLARDAHMTGLSVGALNMEALIERIVPFKEVEKGRERVELAFDESSVPYIEQFLYARDVMYLNCYEHPKKVVAERMLGKAFEEFRRNPDGTNRFLVEDLALLTDQEIIELMRTSAGPGTTISRMLELLMKGVTFRLVKEFPIELDLKSINELKPEALQKLPIEIQRWARAARIRDDQGAYLKIPEDWGKTLARRSECVDESSILITVPSWTIVRNWLKEGEIRILKRAAGVGFTVNYVWKESAILRDFVGALTRARLKIRVFADPDLTSAQEAAVAKQAVKLFA